MSIETGKWSWALERLGFETVPVAGGGAADRILPGLAIGTGGTGASGASGGTGGSGGALSRDEVGAALADADLVVVENLCSLPLNPRAADVVASVLAGRPAILHHHDLAWQRPQFAGWPPPPDDPAWRHVTINERSRLELAEHGIEAVTIYNAFDPDPPAGRRAETRDALGVPPGARLVLQPTRALARKRVGAAIRVAERLGAIYWLLGPAEDGYGPELERVIASACCPVLLGLPQLAHGRAATVADAYAACDVVALTSDVEGFGNPSVESATHRRPLVIGPYPVAAELAAFGFRWFSESPEDLTRLEAWLEAPDPALLDHNAAVARRHFSLTDLPARLGAVLGALGGPGGLGGPGRLAARPAPPRGPDVPARHDGTISLEA